MPDLIDTPAAWYGDELFERPDWEFVLSPSDIAELSAAAVESTQSQLSEISKESFPLPNLSVRLERLQKSLETGSGATAVRGFPIDQFSPEITERAFWGFLQHLGTPLSQSAKGERIFHVRDERFGADDARTRGPNTRKRLSFHTDRCDVIAFLCCQQAKSGGENHFVSSATLYNEIAKRRPDLLTQLMQPYFYKRHNVDRGNQSPFCRQPVFSFCEGHFAGCFLRVLIERAYQSPDLAGMSDLQRAALDFVEELADDPALHARFRQQPGDLLLLNNWVTFHRRTEFEDYEEVAKRRHLLRVWLSVPNSRPIDPLFKDNYGATEAGAIRGGMRKETASGG